MASSGLENVVRKFQFFQKCFDRLRPTLNPFRIANQSRSEPLLDQLDPAELTTLLELSEFGFHGRLLSLAHRALKRNSDERSDRLTGNVRMIYNSDQYGRVFIHKLGFRPTGMMREFHLLL